MFYNFQRKYIRIVLYDRIYVVDTYTIPIYKHMRFFMLLKILPTMN